MMTNKKILIILPAGDKYRITSVEQIVPKRNMLRFSILPLLLVAALTPSDYEVDICDENVQMLDLNTDAGIIGISFMTALAPRAFEIADFFRARGKTVIAGGYFPTLCPEETVSHFDSVIIGDAENLWIKALYDLENSKIQKVYKHAPDEERDQIPIPRRDLIKKISKYYVTINAIQVGRGCYNKCRFCSVTAFYKGKYSRRPVIDIISELKGVSRELIFVDDNIISEPEYSKELFRKIMPLKKRWVSQCSLKIADDPELLTLAKKSGCFGLFIGIENICPLNLRKMDKEFNLERDISERIKIIRNAGIGIVAGLIVGMDGDDVTVFRNTLNFLKNTGIDAIQVNIMTPLPGTPLYKEFTESGRIADTDYSHYDFRHVVIHPLMMTPAELQNGADWIYSQFYRLDNIIMRFLRSIFVIGLVNSFFSLRLNLTYRYDNKREKIYGHDPSVKLSD